MARGKLRTTPNTIRPEDQFTAVNDLKLQMTLAAIADRYNAQIRAVIYRTYQDPEIASLYRAIRASGLFDKGGRSKVHRKILEFPNAYVYDFCDTVMTELYGPDWLKDHRALRHDLIRPWLTVSKL